MGGRAVNQKHKNITANSTPSTGIVVSGGGAPVRIAAHERLQTYVTKFDINTQTFSLDTAGVGAADAIGSKIGTMPEGHILIHGALFNLTVTPQTGLSATSAVISLGTVVAGDGGATLTSTEADIIASHTLGDGTLASATAETHNIFKAGNANVDGVSYYDGSSTAAPLFLNIGGTWTEADDDPALLTVTGNIKLVWSWIGDE